jgi:hypothetical protein
MIHEFHSLPRSLVNLRSSASGAGGSLAVAGAGASRRDKTQVSGCASKCYGLWRVGPFCAAWRAGLVE